MKKFLASMTFNEDEKKLMEIMTAVAEHCNCVDQSIDCDLNDAIRSKGDPSYYVEFTFNSIGDLNRFKNLSNMNE